MDLKSLGGKFKKNIGAAGAKIKANREALGDWPSSARDAVSGRLKDTGQAVQQMVQQGIGAVQTDVPDVVKDLVHVSHEMVQTVREKVSKPPEKDTPPSDNESVTADVRAAEAALAAKKLAVYISKALANAGISDSLRKTYIDGLREPFVAGYIKQRRPSLVNALRVYEEIAAGQGAVLLKALKDNDLARMQANDKLKNEVRDEIERLSVESINEFSETAATLLNTDALAERFKNEGFTVTGKKSVVEIVRFSQDETQAKCLAILEKKAAVLSVQIQKFIAAYVEDRFFADTPPSIAQAAIKCEVLPDYVLGGLVLPPVGWEKIAAKKIVQAFDENDLSGKYRVQIRTFWKQSENAFNRLIVTLDETWAIYINDLHHIANVTDPSVITRRILSLKTLIKLYDDIKKGVAYA
ncbi:MAG: hypothetical protein GX107_04520 [Clostridiales bacterium]|jgi:hypothetical protein|nr:hypothetical protein [Clostridiales bacterium]